MVLSWNLSPTTLGAYTVALSIVGVFTTLLCSGLPLVISKNVASNEVSKNHKASNGNVFAGMVISLFLACLITLLVVFGKPLFSLIFTDNESYIMLFTLLPFIISTAIYAPLRGYLWGKEQYFQVSMVEVVEQIFKIILCIVLFKVMKNVYIYVPGIVVGVSCIISTLLGYYYFKKAQGKIKSYPGTFKEVFKSSTPLTIVRVVGSIINPFISIILPIMLIKGGYTNDQALALIGISMGMVMPLISIPSTVIGSLSMALVPKLNILKNENKNSLLKKQIISAFVFTLCATFIFVPIFSSISVPICEILFNSTKAGEILNAFAWIMIPNGIMMISSSILNSLGYEKYTFFSYGLSSIILILGILILPKYMGINALFLSLGLNGFMVFILNYIKIKKEINIDNSILSKLFVLLLICYPITLLCKYTFNMLSLIFPVFITIALICIISIIITAILMLAFKIIDIEYFNNLKSNLMSKVSIYKKRDKKQRKKV